MGVFSAKKKLRKFPKPLKAPSLARSVPKPLKVPCLACFLPKPLKMPSFARSVLKPLKMRSLARSVPKLLKVLSLARSVLKPFKMEQEGVKIGCQAALFFVPRDSLTLRCRPPTPLVVGSECGTTPPSQL